MEAAQPVVGFTTGAIFHTRTKEEAEKKPFGGCAGCFRVTGEEEKLRTCSGWFTASVQFGLTRSVIAPIGEVENNSRTRSSREKTNQRIGSLGRHHQDNVKYAASKTSRTLKNKQRCRMINRPPG